MKLLLIACIATLALTACDPSKDAAAPAATAPAPSPATTPAPPPAEAPAPAAALAYELAFTLKAEDKSQDSRILRFEDGPCGSTPIAKVAAIPLDDAALLPDFVVEFDAAGKEIKRWGKPYEAEVIGLDGDRLQFRTGATQAFWTDPSGAVGRLDAAPAAAFEPPLIDCPALPTFAKSEYEQCYAVGDAAGQPRKLAWEGVCS